MQYPKVLSEENTLYGVLRGASIARFGDGELSIMRGGNCVSQIYNSFLANDLRTIAAGRTSSPSTNRRGSLIVGIPTLDERSPKLKNWTKLAPRFMPFLTAGHAYGSAFITRPDSAPWIDTHEYFDKIESLWRDQEVVLVANGVRSFTKQFLEERGAKLVTWIKCPYRDAYTEIDTLFNDTMSCPQPRVILACGPTATVLADRLCAAGKHAIDLGHLAMFWRRYANAEQR